MDIEESKYSDAQVEAQILRALPGKTVNAVQAARSGTFGDNMKLPIHRWFRYSAGFSADWAREKILSSCDAKCNIIDPFAGSGTTLIAAQEAGAFALGLEPHPFMAKVADVKIRRCDPSAFLCGVNELLRTASRSSSFESLEIPQILTKCYTPDVLSDLFKLRKAYYSLEMDNDVKALVWLLLTSVLRECSHVGTAQWQYILPNKRKARIKSPIDAVSARAKEIYIDLKYHEKMILGNAVLISDDARYADLVGYEDFFDLAITSPPYPNNYDYADATRLEMSFWGQINRWSELHKAVRHKLVCSCSQHASIEKFELSELLENKLLDPIRKHIERVCRNLEVVREKKAGKKAYHTMVAAYFIDLANVWMNLRKYMKSGSASHFVIGDSAPYGIHVPCDLWLGELALAAGFKSFEFEKLRDRNTKWKNRKHNFPLHEGILKVVG